MAAEASKDTDANVFAKAPIVSARALIVAVANYKTVPSLPQAVLNDAQDLAAVLTDPAYGGLNPANVRQLIDDQATLNGIRQALSSLAAETTEEETVILYFTGHGLRLTTPTDTSALAPYDADALRPNETTLLESEFSAALAALKARRLLVLLDACHSGGAGVLKGGVREILGFSEKSLSRLSQGVGRVVMASSRADETSGILAGARNSLFTQHLLEALKGATAPTGDGFIRVFEVFNYVSQQVKASLPGRQHPIFKASGVEDNFPIALRLGGVKALTTGAAPVATPPVTSLDALMADLYPTGPIDQDIWLRAGGDLSRLRLTGTGRANWFNAIRTLELGGGGTGMSRSALLSAALDDYPHHPALHQLAT